MRYTVLFLVWEDLNFFLVTLQNFEELKMCVPGLLYIVMQQLSASILIDNHLLSLQVWHLPQTVSLQSSVNFLIWICHLHFSTLSFWRIRCHFTQPAQIRQQLTNFEQIGSPPSWQQIFCISIESLWILSAQNSPYFCWCLFQHGKHTQGNARHPGSHSVLYKSDTNQSSICWCSQ